MYAAPYKGPNQGGAPQFVHGASGSSTQPVNTKQTVGVTFQIARESLNARQNVKPQEKPLGSLALPGKRALSALDVKPRMPLIVYSNRKRTTTTTNRNPHSQAPITSAGSGSTVDDRNFNAGEVYLQGFTSFNGLPTAHKVGDKFVDMTQDEWEDQFMIPGFTAPETNNTQGDPAQRETNGNVILQGLFPTVNLSTETMLWGDRVVVLPPFIGEAENANWDAKRASVKGFTDRAPKGLQTARMEVFDMSRHFLSIRQKALDAATAKLFAPGNRQPLDFKPIGAFGPVSIKISRSESLGLSIARRDFTIALAAAASWVDAGYLKTGTKTIDTMVSDLIGGPARQGGAQQANAEVQMNTIKAIYPGRVTIPAARISPLANARQGQAAQAPPRMAIPTGTNDLLLKAITAAESEERKILVRMTEKAINTVKMMVVERSEPGADLSGAF